MTAEPLTGWRAWGVKDDGSLTPLFPQPVPHSWGGGWNRADCRHKHLAPAPECVCGIYVITSESEMWAFVRWAFRVTRMFPGVSKLWVVGQVEYEGAALASLDRSDPPSTLRVERARVVGPIVVLSGAEPLAAAIRDRYGVPVYDQTQHELHRVLWGRVIA
jgi:hypothetical protein